MDNQQKIVDLLQAHKELTGGQLAKTLKISRQALSKHLKALLNKNVIYKTGSTKQATYFLSDLPPVKTKKIKLKNITEDQIFNDLFSDPHKWHAKKDAWEILYYSFTELLNNVIEHAESSTCLVTIHFSFPLIGFSITDYGVGIFEKIKKFKKLKDHFEALEELLKGKCTTDPKHHTGEGIFFTTKTVAYVEIESSQLKLTLDNASEDHSISESKILKGTRIHIKINLNSSKKLQDIFEKYTEKHEFSKTHIYIQLYKRNGPFISRSEAKRLVHSLEKFREIILDFNHISSIGQGFADEIFRVFQNKYPSIKLTSLNINPQIHFMIQRALKRK